MKQQKKIKNKNAITLVALVVTVIVLLILSGVIFATLTSETGLITVATEAAFREEINKISEQIYLSSIQTMLIEDNIQSIYTEKVPLADTENWDMTLKMEILNWGSYDETKKAVKESYVKSNFNSLISIGQETKYLYYVTGANVKEHTYIYDTSSNVVFKIPSTKIWQYTVHSVDELDYLYGITTRENRKISLRYTLTQHEVELKTVNNIKCYEPDLNGMAKETTSLVFYKMADSTLTGDTYFMSIDEWLNSGKPNQITKDDYTYILYDYSNSIWANIKVISHGVETWWTWIPRYSYALSGTTSTTVFVNTANEVVNSEEGEYTIAPAFKDNTKYGIWTSKYEPATTTNNENENIADVPDLTGLDATKTYLALYNDEMTAFTEFVQVSTIDNLTTFAGSHNWYDYEECKWANIKIIDNNIETWWVWIPRYAYSVDVSDTILITTQNKTLSGEDLPIGYAVAPAFLDNTKKGIWISKYEPSSVTSDVTEDLNIVPDLSGLDATKTYLAIYDNEMTAFTEFVQVSTINNLKTFAENNNWYDYKNQKWANIKIIDNSIETWWVWIPRYAYSVDVSDTILITTENKTLSGDDLPTGYTVAPAFLDNTKKGIWISKYEPSEITEK